MVDVRTEADPWVGGMRRTAGTMRFGISQEAKGIIGGVLCALCALVFASTCACLGRTSDAPPSPVPVPMPMAQYVPYNAGAPIVIMAGGGAPVRLGPPMYGAAPESGGPQMFNSAPYTGGYANYKTVAPLVETAAAQGAYGGAHFGAQPTYASMPPTYAGGPAMPPAYAGGPAMPQELPNSGPTAGSYATYKTVPMF